MRRYFDADGADGGFSDWRQVNAGESDYNVAERYFYGFGIARRPAGNEPAYRAVERRAAAGYAAYRPGF